MAEQWASPSQLSTETLPSLQAHPTELLSFGVRCVESTVQ